MTKRILLIFCVLAALILPASAATHNGKHVASRSRKAKSVRKSSASRGSRSAKSGKRSPRTRSSSGRQKLTKK